MVVYLGSRLYGFRLIFWIALKFRELNEESRGLTLSIFWIFLKFQRKSHVCTLAERLLHSFHWFLGSFRSLKNEIQSVEQHLRLRYPPALRVIPKFARLASILEAIAFGRSTTSPKLNGSLLSKFKNKELEQIRIRQA